MASNNHVFNISYKALLASIADKLGWSPPIYNTLETEENSVYVLLRRSQIPIAYYFAGPSSATTAESEEDAAEQAVDYLVQKKKVIVDDMNLAKRQMYKACSGFYKDKTMSLDFVTSVSPRLSLSRVIDLTNQPLSSRTLIVSIDFWGLLLQIVAALKLNITEVEDLVYDNDTQVSSLQIIWDKGYNNVRYFIGDCSCNLEEARNSLAKRTVCYLQSVLHFAVKDANYYGMLYEEMCCGVQCSKYLTAKDKMDSKMLFLEGQATDKIPNDSRPKDNESKTTSEEELQWPQQQTKKFKTLGNDVASSSKSKKVVNIKSIAKRF